MDLVRMIKGERVRHVRAKVVNKMRQNGWQVDEPPKRRRKSSTTDQAPETDSGAFSRPETEQESE